MSFVPSSAGHAMGGGAPAPQAGRLQSELGQSLARFRSAWVTLGVFSMVINLLGLVPSLYMLQMYDRVLVSRNLGTLWAISAIAVALIALLASLEWVRANVLVRIGNQLDHQMGGRVFDANFHQLLRQGRGNPVQPLADFANVRQFLTGPAIGYFDLPWVPIYLLACFLLHPVLGLISLLGLLVSVTLAVVTSRLTEPVLSQAQKAAMQANGFAGNQLRNVEVMEAMGMLSGIRRRWWDRHGQMLALQSRASDRAAVLAAASKNFRVAMQSVILGAGAYLVVEGSATPGTMIAASILMGKALGPVDQVIGSWKQVVAVRDAWDRLVALLQAQPAPPVTLTLPAPTGQLRAEGLLAAPPGRAGLVLRGVSFAARPGEILGVVGPSASGKSTLARVLVGIWPTAGGTVRLDGADVSTWNKSELGPHIGYLPQDVALMEGSVAENIARFGPLDDEKIVRAAQAAGVHEMVLRLPSGYETPLGAGGAGLSGGQRQRIALARALYGDPALVVLDEPNASLDDAGEAALLQAILALKEKGRTIIMIAHRLSVLNVVDNLLVLNDGVVAAFGPRQQVLQLNSAQAPQNAIGASAPQGAAS
ncbi:MAG: type I secretion system permease/ATPase [Ramlibacter sp.]|nr:type I secretion system permease/ATPase [Ramlibacter sp.]